MASTLEGIRVFLSNLSGAITGTAMNILGTAGENHTGNVGGESAKVEVTLAARPANTTAYAIGDVLNADTIVVPISFTVARANDTTGWVIGGKCTSSATVATAPNIDLLLFDATFATAADNAAFAPTDANMLTYIGKVNFNSWVSYSTTASASDGTVATPFAFAPASGTQLIYGVAVLKNAYVPVSGEVFSFSLDVDQN